MSEYGSLVAYLSDPRLTAHATSALPAWLWSADATRVLWANPTGAAIFDAPSPAALVGSTIDPKGTAALQIARLAATLRPGAAPRLERLRGFGAPLGRALMCACFRVILADRTAGILVVATEAAGPNLSLIERVQRLLVGIAEPIAVFAPDGAFMHATSAGLERSQGLKTLVALGATKLASEALAAGRAQGTSHVGPVAVERVGSAADAVIMVTFEQAKIEAKPEAQEAAPEAPLVPAPAPVAALAAAPEPPPQAVTPAEPMSARTLAAAHVEVAAAAFAPRSSERRQPLRFVWQMDAEGRLTLTSDEFIELIGPQTAASLSKPWSEAASALALDPDGHVTRAIASRDTWSGLTINVPADGSSERLPVELSGLPVFDRERSFKGYRGFGICRDATRIAALLSARRSGALNAPKTTTTATTTATTTTPVPAEPRDEPPALRIEPPVEATPPAENVVPFRTSGTPEKPLSLTPIERKAFRELASRLTARLRSADDQATPETPKSETASEAAPEPASEAAALTSGTEPKDEHPAGEHTILDHLPIGVLVYRHDRLIYGNQAFLDWTGYDNLQALSDAGGLDTLFAEPNGTPPNENNGAKTLTIATRNGDHLPVEARLFASPWEGESALVLMITSAGGEERLAAADAALRAAKSETTELQTVIDTASDGVIVFDRDGLVTSLNRSAEALFGYESRELTEQPLATLFAPESQRTARDDLDSANKGGREIIGRTREGRTIPLFMTIGSLGDDTGRRCAVFRDITQWKRSEEELVNAKRQAEKASSAKSDFLAKVSHEIRTPLNAIIGFSEVMMGERFGPIGNDRYRQYLKDIHASGEHLISLLNDLLDLSKIEAGKLDLNFVSVDLNELTQQCVALMQPQANRERIIIRTSLAPSLQPVVADARSVRQIVLNLLSNSIKFTGAGGQVIVSTAVSDAGEVALRVRDTGAGMSEKEIAVAMEPFRQLATSARFGSGGSGLGLPLTKALAEANRATFRIRSAVNVGTLVEVAFPGARMAAE